MKLSKKGIDLIKSLEGFSPTCYKDVEGNNTIGYGHLITIKDMLFGHVLTKTQAEQLLLSDVKVATNAINNNVCVSLTQGQFDALVSLVFNWGITNFLKSQGLKVLNANDLKEAAIQFFSDTEGVVRIKDSKTGKMITSSGLIERRQAELAVWDNKSS